MKVLVTYYSKSGNTAAMAKVLSGALEQRGAEVVQKEAGQTTPEDLLSADAVAVGSPDYFSYVAGQVKTLFDEALSEKSKLSGKPGGCFSSHGGGARIKEPFEHLVEAVGLKLVAPCVLSHDAPAGKTVDELHSLAAALCDAAG